MDLARTDDMAEQFGGGHLGRGHGPLEERPSFPLLTAACVTAGAIQRPFLISIPGTIPTPTSVLV
ncbi:MAG: hypothetical protein HRF40_10270 [Nitrososphaera sp.]